MTCVLQEDEGPKDEDPETNEKNGRLYDKAGKIRKMKHEQASPFLLDTLTNVFFLYHRIPDEWQCTAKGK